MPRVCTICGHNEVATIDRKLAAGIAPISQIAREFNASEDALRRHKKSHIPQTLALAGETRVVDADSLVGDLLDLRSRTLQIPDSAEKSGKLVVALQAIREVRALIATLADADAARRQTLSANQAHKLVSLVIRSVQAHVADPVVLEGIQDDIRAALSEQQKRPTP